MPLAAAVVPALIGGAAAIYSGSQANKANARSTEANNQAAAASLAAQQQNLDRAYTLQDPAIQGRNAALDAVMTKYGLTPSGGASKTPGGSAGTSPLPAGPQPDWNAYLSANPDVAAQAQVEGRNPVEYAQAHYQAFGQQEGRALPQTGTQPTQPTEQTAPTAPTAPTLTRPEAPARPPPTATPIYTRPEQPEWQDMGDGPSSADYLDPSKFETSPGYEFRLNEGNRNLNAKYGARGLLKSGGAIKGFTDYNQGAASAEFANWYQQALARLNSDRAQFNNNRQASYNIFNTDRQNLNANFDTDRAVNLTQGNFETTRNDNIYSQDLARSDGNFESDRGYGANRDDRATNDLFQLINGGNSAAATLTGAGTTFANNASNIYQNQADNTSNSAYARANNNAQMVGAIGGAAANIFSRYAPTAVAPGSTSGQYGAWTGGMGNWGF